jgi:hypothetical protein
MIPLRRSFLTIGTVIAMGTGCYIAAPAIVNPAFLALYSFCNLYSFSASGFVDHSGHFAFHQINAVISGQSFSDGMLLLADHSCLDKHGQELFKLKAIDALPFSEGLAVVREEAGWGFIDHAGAVVIPSTFVGAKSFREGLAPVKTGRFWGFINKAGVLVVPSRFDDALPFSEGLAAVAKEGKIGFIDHSGRMVIAPEYDRAMSFQDGLTIVGLRVGPKAAWHDLCIDQVGKPAFDLTARQISDGAGKKIRHWYDWVFLSDEVGMVTHDPEPRFGRELFNTTDRHLSWPPEIGRFSSARFLYCNGTKYGYLDKKGDLAIPCIYSQAGSFREGLAVVGIDAPGPESSTPNRLYGYVDPAGKFVISPRFSAASDFHEGLARVQEGKGDEFIDKTGKVIFKAPGGEAGDFHDGLAPVGGAVYGL